MENPMILQPTRLLDYGKGFYTTTSEQQSKEWVERRMREKIANGGYVNVYEFDDAKMEVLLTSTCFIRKKHWLHCVSLKHLK